MTIQIISSLSIPIYRYHFTTLPLLRLVASAGTALSGIVAIANAYHVQTLGFCAPDDHRGVYLAACVYFACAVAFGLSLPPRATRRQW